MPDHREVTASLRRVNETGTFHIVASGEITLDIPAHDALHQVLRRTPTEVG